MRTKQFTSAYSNNDEHLAITPLADNMVSHCVSHLLSISHDLIQSSVRNFYQVRHVISFCRFLIIHVTHLIIHELGGNVETRGTILGNEQLDISTALNLNYREIVE